MENEFVVPTSNKVATFTKPKIRPGFYAAQLIDIKIKDKEGKFFEKVNVQSQTRSNYAILEFAIYKAVEDDSNPESYTVGDPVVVKIDHGTQEVTLSQFINWRYIKTDAKGNVEYRSGISPGRDGSGSMAAKTFQALGWAGPDGAALNMQSFIGAWAGALVVDYKDKQNVEFSVIQNLVQWKGPTPQSATGTPSAVKEDVISPAPSAAPTAFTQRVEALKKQLDEGIITQRGYDIAVASLRSEYGVN